MTKPVWTYSIIAKVCGVTRQVAQRWLVNSRPDGQALIKGVYAGVYHFTTLSETVRQRLLTVARSRGYADVNAMAEHAMESWQSPIPLSQVPARYLAKAEKLRDALAPVLSRSGQSAPCELLSAAREAFQRAHGYALSDKQLGRLIDRTIWRDSNLRAWQRTELYLDEKAFTIKPAPENLPRAFDHRALDEHVAHLENRSAPTLNDRRNLFHFAFLHFEQIGGGTRAKKSIVSYLLSTVPGLTIAAGDPFKALLRLFEIKHRQWIECGRQAEALKDKRESKSGPSSYACSDCDTETKKLALALRGNETLARRELHEQGRLCATCAERYSLELRKNKSYQAKSVRQRTRPNELEQAFFRGEREGRMTGPHIPRDWSDVMPGDYFMADDETPNQVVYCDVDGERITGRVQFLLMSDLRTGYPLDFIMYFGPPTGRRIRQLLFQVCARGVGLPRVGCYFEKGVFASRWIDGKHDGQHSFADTEAGLTSLLKVFRAPLEEEETGIRAAGLNLWVRHATTPRAKPIEGDFKIHQSRMSVLPGFVGFNERLERMEYTQDFIRRAKSKDGKVDASEGLLSLAEFAQAYRSQLEHYAHDPQNGKRLQGRSPFEAWSEHYQRHPLKKLPAEMEYLLATHRTPATVRADGIQLQLSRSETALYCNERTGALIGEKVIAYYNIDCPDLLTVYHPRKQEKFTVERILLPAMSATPEQLATANRAISGHTAKSRELAKQARAIVGDLHHRLVNTIVRDDDFPAEAKDLGEFHNAEVERHQAEKSAQERKVRRIQREALTLGAPVNPQIRNPDRVQDGLEWEKEIMQKLQAKEGEQ